MLLYTPLYEARIIIRASYKASLIGKADTHVPLSRALRTHGTLLPATLILAGMALEPTSPPVRAWPGMALLAGGAGWLVFAPAEETEVEELDLLNTRTADMPRRPPTGT